MEYPTGCSVAYADGPIGACRAQSPAVRTERNAQNEVVVARENTAFFSGFRITESDGPVLLARGQDSTVRAERNALNDFVCLEVEEFRPTLDVPHITILIGGDREKTPAVGGESEARDELIVVQRESIEIGAILKVAPFPVAKPLWAPGERDASRVEVAFEHMIVRQDDVCVVEFLLGFPAQSAFTPKIARPQKEAGANDDCRQDEGRRSGLRDPSQAAAVAALREGAQPVGDIGCTDKAFVRIAGQATMEIVAQQGVAHTALPVGCQRLRKISDNQLIVQDTQRVDV
jgi:hypothetical protein